MDLSPRDLSFSRNVEAKLVDLSHQSKTNLNTLRSRYRHAIVASGMTSHDALNYITSGSYQEPLGLPDVPDEVAVLELENCSSAEHAINMLAEFSGLGYAAVPALRGAWKRAVRDDEDPYQRTLNLAYKTYESPDADLLPVQFYTD